VIASTAEQTAHATSPVIVVDERDDLRGARLAKIDLADRAAVCLLTEHAPIVLDRDAVSVSECAQVLVVSPTCRRAVLTVLSSRLPTHAAEGACVDNFVQAEDHEAALSVE
jgi:hypothetical protein